MSNTTPPDSAIAPRLPQERRSAPKPTLEPTQAEKLARRAIIDRICDKYRVSFACFLPDAGRKELQEALAARANPVAK